MNRNDVKVTAVLDSPTRIVVSFDYEVPGYDRPVAGNLTYYRDDDGFTMNANFFSSDQMAAFTEIAEDVQAGNLPKEGDSYNTLGRIL